MTKLFPFLLSTGIPLNRRTPRLRRTFKDTIFGWNEAIYPYVKNIQVFRCPDIPRATGLPSIAGYRLWLGRHQCHRRNQLRHQCAHRGDDGPLDDGASFTRHWPLPRLDFAASTIMLVDASSDCGDGCATSDENEWAWEGRHVDNLYGDGWISGNEPGAQFIRGGKAPLARHSGGANYGFSDGHVKFLNAGAMGLMTDTHLSRRPKTTPPLPLTPKASTRRTVPNANCTYNVTHSTDELAVHSSILF